MRNELSAASDYGLLGYQIDNPKAPLPVAYFSSCRYAATASLLNHE